MTSEQDQLRQIEELRLELHRRLGGQYAPERVAQLVEISQQLDRLVVEVTRRQWSGAGPSGLPTSDGYNGDQQSGRYRQQRPS